MCGRTATLNQPLPNRSPGLPRPLSPRSPPLPHLSYAPPPPASWFAPQVYARFQPERLGTVILDSCLGEYDQDLAVELLTATLSQGRGTCLDRRLCVLFFCVGQRS